MNGSRPACSTNSATTRCTRMTASSAWISSEVALDGSLHKAPCGGEGTGPNPTDRAKLGLEVVRRGRRERHPDRLGDRRRQPQRPQTPRTDTRRRRARRPARRDRDPAPRPRLRLPQDPPQLASFGLDDLNIQRRRKRGDTTTKQPMRLGLRWVVEGTNSWLSNYGQLRRNTDRRTRHRHAQLCLVTALLITAKLIDWRDRWSPDSRPIR